MKSATALIPTPARLLFICLGNICRSPAAQGIMQALVDSRGLSECFYLDSAGMGSWHVGQLPDSRMRRAGKEHGYTFDHRARQFHASQDFDAFDLILTMDDENYRDVVSQAQTGEERSKVRRMASYLRTHSGVREIPDPYYSGADGFHYVIRLLEDACAGLLDDLTQR